MARQALGRGLSALIPDKPPAATDENLVELDIDLISPNPAQPRTTFDEVKLEELAQSIRENGIVQPILVRRKAGRYEIIAGERRWRAAQRAGLQRISSVVRNIPDEKLLELALIENIQRQELNPIEEAKAYKSLIETLGLTQEITAKRVGRDRTYITSFLRLLKLPLDVQELLEAEKLSTGHARALLQLTQISMQSTLARKIVDQALSVRETEKTVKKLLETGKEMTKSEPTPVNADFRNAENRLRRRMGTKVRIAANQKGPGGRIEIEYYDDQDLIRIYDLIMPKEQIPGH
jgi:ParB family chromosome partitioning protein